MRRPWLDQHGIQLADEQVKAIEEWQRLLFACLGEDHELVSAEELNREIPIE